jgi:hypothetical protein
MQKVGAKPGAVFPQAVVQVARSKILGHKKFQFGVGAGSVQAAVQSWLPIVCQF